jgi:hypothetical protein
MDDPKEPTGNRSSALATPADARGVVGGTPGTRKSASSRAAKSRPSSSQNSDDQDRPRHDATASDADRLAELGNELYREHKAQLEQHHFGRYVIFNVENGKYVIGESQLDAIKAFRAEHAHAPGWCRGIGFVSRV